MAILKWRIFIEKSFYIYILASKRNGTLYVGVTSDLIKRIWEHKIGAVSGFTKKREKQLKKWKREWKLNLIEKSNPAWRDLHNDII